MRCLAVICTLLVLTLAMLVSTAAGQDCCGVGCHCCTCAGGPPCASPIIVDTTGQGFQLTNGGGWRHLRYFRDRTSSSNGVDSAQSS